MVYTAGDDDDEDLGNVSYIVACGFSSFFFFCRGGAENFTDVYKCAAEVGAVRE